MKIELTNGCDNVRPHLKDLPAGSCAWIQSYDEPDSPFTILVMVTNCEGKKSYVCLENGFSRPPNNCFMSYPAIPTDVKIVKGN